MKKRFSDSLSALLLAGQIFCLAAVLPGEVLPQGQGFCSVADAATVSGTDGEGMQRRGTLRERLAALGVNLPAGKGDGEAAGLGRGLRRDGGSLRDGLRHQSVFVIPKDARKVDADDLRIAYMGRWQHNGDGTMSTGRGAVTLELAFRGSFAAVEIQGEAPVWWEVSVDDGPFRRFRGEDGVNILASGLGRGNHTLVLVRDTEGSQGVTRVERFLLDRNSWVLPARDAKGKVLAESGARRIEFVGDSVTAGAFLQPGEDYFQREDGYRAFGPRTARLLGAEWSCVASSGEGVARNNQERPPYDSFHAADQYDRTFFSEEEPRWNSFYWKPDVVVVAFGENDYNDPSLAPAPAVFRNAYRELLGKIRRMNPEAVILCLSPAGFDSAGPASPQIQSVVEGLRLAGDRKVYWIDLHEKPDFYGIHSSGGVLARRLEESAGLVAGRDLLMEGDFLDGVHPRSSGHEKMARILAGKIAGIMDWDLTEREKG